MELKDTYQAFLVAKIDETFMQIESTGSVEYTELQEAKQAYKTVRDIRLALAKEAKSEIDTAKAEYDEIKNTITNAMQRIIIVENRIKSHVQGIEEKEYIKKNALEVKAMSEYVNRTTKLEQSGYKLNGDRYTRGLNSVLTLDVNKLTNDEFDALLVIPIDLPEITEHVIVPVADTDLPFDIDPTKEIFLIPCHEYDNSQLFPAGYTHGFDSCKRKVLALVDKNTQPELWDQISKLVY